MSHQPSIALGHQRCKPCEGEVAALTTAEREPLLAQLQPCWKLIEDDRQLEAVLTFKNYYHTTAFVSAVAFIAHREDHHPEIRFDYKTCTIRWWTHNAKGLTENDFICAAQVDELLKKS
jgi:4a-hydroxytetrahydrobiopterin dehydratase